jgi:SAM-dependent methyltransferase
MATSDSTPPVADSSVADLPDADPIDTTRASYDRAYKAEGFAAQRLYPNEELLRFLGRNFFGRLPREQRKGIRVLEVGCGSGANLWMIAREGFDTHGLELSPEALVLCEQMLLRWGERATLHTASMTEMPLASASMDVVVDVFSSNCLPTPEFVRYLGEARRVLRPGGLLFSYTPSAESEAFTRPEPAVHLDEHTLSGIYRADSPFTGNHYPFRFETPEHVGGLLTAAGFQVRGIERVSRTYRNRGERFEFLSLEAVAV